MTQKGDLKIILLGESKVGKTTLMIRIIKNEFDNPKTTIGASYMEKTYEGLDGKNYLFNIWDTAGQEKFDSLSTFYTRDAGCALILYDITDRKSFLELERFFKKLEFADEKVFAILIGTKYDLVAENEELREVSIQEGSEKAKLMNSDFFEISSKTTYNIDKLFERIGSKYLRIYRSGGKKAKGKKGKPRHSVFVTNLSDDEENIEKDKKCCK
ncbi:rab gtpase [Anaeramoeba flamelloides]|uniref:Rab gtpase n=1 Tax=Anaeramoeba flamelloides TaxID=1746091 RepID=A0AAV7Z771_9EUKA|nr:rab gtpase [Anaeramoeba flamelloides]